MPWLNYVIAQFISASPECKTHGMHALIEWRGEDDNKSQESRFLNGNNNYGNIYVLFYNATILLYFIILLNVRVFTYPFFGQA